MSEEQQEVMTEGSGRKLVYKAIIDSIEPIEGADKIEVVRIKGWRVVVGKGEFKEGEVVLFFETDSALNPWDLRYEFLKERCYKKFMLHGKLFDECLRLRTIRLRGVYSQGLVMKTDLFCEVRNKKVGEDCTLELAVRHYDEVAEKAVRVMEHAKPGNAKGLFPSSIIPRTDEERVQNLEDEVLIKHADEPLEVTEKKDGSSCTIFFSPSYRADDPFGVCSRNFELKDEGDGIYWKLCHKFDLEHKLPAYCQEHNCELALQGEIIGPGVNGNHDSLSDFDYQIFRIWDIKNQKWLTCNERYKVCKDLNIPHVPVLEVKTLKDFDLDRDKILLYAEGYTAAGHEREGVVFKSIDGDFHFKAVSNRYLLSLK